jgi:hypothetical protein
LNFSFKKIFKNSSENKLMTITGLTIQEIANKLEIPYGTAAMRLKRAGIKPLLKEDVYPRIRR